MLPMTPTLLAKGNNEYSIPIYQRLFEWGDEQIEKLLDDLFNAMKKSLEDYYYIGMLTATTGNNSNEFQLVDGQQRFTVLTLLGITFLHKGCEEDWFHFLRKGEENRLTFAARDEDKTFLRRLIDSKEFYDNVLKGQFGNNEYVNVKMVSGLRCMYNYLYRYSDDEINDLSYFSFNNTAFFVSVLPYHKAWDLNRYFERMNSTGKNLESYEMLKVKMLQNIQSLDSESYPKFVKAWNQVNNMGSCLNDNVLTVDDFSENQEANPDEGSTIAQMIEEVKSGINPQKPSQQTYTEVEHAPIMSFPRFLLQVLYYFLIKKYIEEGEVNPWQKLNDRNDFKVNDFFDVTKISLTFDHFLPDAKDYMPFIETLYETRRIFDKYVIRIDNSRRGYSLPLTEKILDEDAEDNVEVSENDKADARRLVMFESMLYVSSTNTTFYRWLPKLFYDIEYEKCTDCSSLLSALKSIDNDIHCQANVELSYHNIDRYWFWRLDYYLWEENLDKKDKGDYIGVVDKYTFSRNRSIEHLHPQNDFYMEEYEQWNDEQKDSFFNLALVTPGFNSIQSNDDSGAKLGRIEDQVEHGRIESLKLYDMYKKAKDAYGSTRWNKELAKEHGVQMMECLIKSFGNNGKYSEIRSSLKEQEILNLQIFS